MASSAPSSGVTMTPDDTGPTHVLHNQCARQLIEDAAITPATTVQPRYRVRLASNMQQQHAHKRDEFHPPLKTSAESISCRKQYIVFLQQPRLVPPRAQPTIQTRAFLNRCFGAHRQMLGPNTCRLAPGCNNVVASLTSVVHLERKCAHHRPIH